MRVPHVVGALLLLVLLITVLAIVPSRADPAVSSAIVVELFTSEGCSSCPPADKLLGELAHRGNIEGRPVIVLGEHVDYWNDLGWKDRFSSPIFTQRQRDYVRALGVNSAYTPEMVVNGHTELVGNDAGALARAISAEKNAGKTTVALDFVAPGTAKIKVAHASPGSRVLFAITEDNLVTHVQRGENGGRELRHQGVVRQLKQVGTAGAEDFETSVAVSLPDDWKRQDIRLIVLVQKSAGGVIEGAAATALR